jgi:hypothetical protein
MGLIAMLYKPDDMGSWPALDLDHPDTQKDLTNLETMGWRDASGGEHDHEAHQH